MVNEYFSGTLLFHVTDRGDFGLPPFLFGLLLPDTNHRYRVIVARDYHILFFSFSPHNVLLPST